MHPPPKKGRAAQTTGRRERSKNGNNMKNLESSAAALYDGGWRAEDAPELAAEYGLTPAEAEDLCEKLAGFEEETKWQK